MISFSSRFPEKVHACSPLCNLPCNFKQRKPFQPHDFKGFLPRLKRARYPLCGQFASSSLCVYSPSWSSFCCADPSLKRDLLVFVGIQRSELPAAGRAPGFNCCCIIASAKSCFWSSFLQFRAIQPSSTASAGPLPLPGTGSTCWRFSDASHT